MPVARPRDLILGGLVLAALVALVGVTASPGAGNQAAGTGSSFSNRPDGARAAYLTLRALGYRVERSHEALALLTVDPAATTLVLASPRAPFSDQDRRALRTFIEAGGRVLATGVGGARALGGDVDDSLDSRPALDPERYTYHPREEAGIASGAPAITMALELRDPALGKVWERVYGPSSEAVVQQASIGEGGAIWWAASTPLTNGAIAEQHNFELLLNVLGDDGRSILWDEHYHGHARSFWSYAAGTPMPWIGGHLALLALALLLTHSRRPGPLRPRPADPRTRPMEFVETIGGLYERAGVNAAAVGASLRRMRRVIGGSCGLGPDVQDEQLAAAAAARMGFREAELLGLLHEAALAARGPVEPADALRIARQLQESTARASSAALRCRMGGQMGGQMGRQMGKRER